MLVKAGGYGGDEETKDERRERMNYESREKRRQVRIKVAVSRLKRVTNKRMPYLRR